MKERILMVDDEPNVLEAYRAILRKRFKVDTAGGGAEALERIKTNGPYCVVISDLRMPGMDGVAFLAKAREAAPNTVRMMLTGNADVDSAILAVNEGDIFRFLTKPCPPELLIKALEAGVRQYHLVIAERELLEKTLKGATGILTDLLSMTNPVAFGRAIRVRRLVSTIARGVDAPESWQWEIAAMLSQVGCITMPQGLLQKYYEGEMLSADERQLFLTHPELGAKLVAKVPRMEEIAECVRHQERDYSGGSPTGDPASGPTTGGPAGDNIPAGARAMHIALAYDNYVSTRGDATKALQLLRRESRRYDPTMLEAFCKALESAPTPTETIIHIGELRPGMVIARDVYDKSHKIIIARGQTVTTSLTLRLKNAATTLREGQTVYVQGEDEAE